MTFPQNLVAVVTGGSRGIGLATASALLERGATVAITGTDEDRLEKARAALAATGRGDRVRAFAADVRDAQSIARTFSAIVDEFGGLDVLVNNAGVGGFVQVAEMSAADWHRVVDTNLTGVYYCCHAALPHLKSRGGGWIINVSSLAGKNPFVGGAAYCASKAGLNAFSEALMQEVRHDGIRVSYVMPGSVRTGFSSGEGPGTEWKLSPDDVARVIVDLIGHPPRSLPSSIEIRPSRPPRK
jgi:NAD(P)-dependent dehydrogenase (short-subunit alcohol dehydrogenase family)